jgi:nucleoside-diphosphate-sugar epimerase
MPRAVVTGAAGFIGSHLCEQLVQRGWDVVALDNLLTGRRDNIEALLTSGAFSFVEYDVTNYVHVPGPVDAVLHFASPASPKDYLEHPIKTLKVGSLGTHKTLGMAKEKRARYLLASTSEVYGDPQVHPQPESYWGNVNPVGPRGVYDEAKRFAEALAMAYHRAHDLDVKIVRIFNSILGDEQVLYDDGTELRREPVEGLARRLAGQVDLDGYRVPAFDPANGVVDACESSGLVAHRPIGKCFEVRSRYGRTVRVTGDHSLFIEGPDGLPVARPVRELSVGDRVAIAGRVVVPERDRTDISLVEVWDAAGRDPWDMHVVAPGLGQTLWNRRFDAFAPTAARFAPDSKTWRNSVWATIRSWRDRHTVPVALMRKLGIAFPAGAMVGMRSRGAGALLPLRLQISDELLWLLGVHVAEGCRYESDHDAFLAISSDLDVVERAAKVIERELNIHCVTVAPSAERAPAIFVHSRLLVMLFDHLGFVAGDKRIPGWVLGLPLRRLKWFMEGYREGDGVHSGPKVGHHHVFVTTSTALKDDLVVALGRFGLVPSIGRHESSIKRYPGRRYPFWMLTMQRVTPWSPLNWDDGATQVLQARRTGDIVWASVKEITEIPPTQLVYDFCVPGRENFYAGVGMLVKNTYGPFLRPADGRVVSNFLVQAMDGAPLTIYGDGEQSRSFCYVEDEVRGILALLESDWVGPMNIGNPHEFTILELAAIVKEVTGSSSPIVHEPLPVDDPTQRRPDITLAEKVLGWHPEIDLREGLRRTFEWYRQERARG